MKKAKLFLMGVIILSAMLCCSLNAFALTDGDWEFRLLDDEVMITRYLGSDEDIVMPSYIYGLPVTSLDKKFWIGEAVKSVVFPDGIKSIDGCCSYARNLEKVVLPEGLEIIGYQAFGSCNKLKSINIPDSVKSIDSYAFIACSNLKQVNIPDNVTLGGYAFAGSGLTSVDMTGKHIEMGTDVFMDCKSLKSITFSEYTTAVSACGGCTALENVTIPNSVTKIAMGAFSGCSSLKQIILPTSLKIIEAGSFSDTGIEELVIPYGTEIMNSIFYGSESEALKSVYVPDTVKKFTWQANCPNAIVYCSADSEAAKYCKENKVSHLTDTSVNSGVHVYYNGKRISFHSYGQNPEISEGRTLVPLRSVFEAMGAKVEWDDAAKSAVARRGNVEVKIQIGANEIYKNGEAIALDVPARIMNDRAMVPARVIAEAFGADVEWNNNGRAVLITE